MIRVIHTGSPAVQKRIKSCYTYCYCNICCRMFSRHDRSMSQQAGKNKARIWVFITDVRCSQDLSLERLMQSSIFPSHNQHNVNTVLLEIPTDIKKTSTAQQRLVKEGCQHLLISQRLSCTLIANCQINTKTIQCIHKIMIKKSENKLQ